jgi:hypothetical protein
VLSVFEIFRSDGAKAEIYKRAHLVPKRVKALVLDLLGPIRLGEIFSVFLRIEPQRTGAAFGAGFVSSVNIGENIDIYINKWQNMPIS